MKYYIPTTNLNIDNLLSTESISPYVKYMERKFKPNYFERILPSTYNSVILLFSRIPSFNLNDKEIEQYPIVLEIEDEQQLNDCVIVASCEDFTVYSCNHTIYLTPWNTHILTFSNRGYERSKIIIESSRNCKIGNKFIWKAVDSGFPLDIMLSKINIETNVARISNDMQINVAKGALWGYIIGLSKSLTPDAAKLMRIANNMRNIVSNAISNSGVCKPNFYERLITLNKEYSKIADRKANEHWTKECSSEESSILNKFHVLKDAIIIFFKANNYSITPELPTANCDKREWISYREHLSSYTQSYIRKASLFNLDAINLDLLGFDGNDIKIKGLNLVNVVLKLICSGEIDKEKLRVNRVETMKMILSSVSTILIEQCGKDKWATIPDERKYINSLAKNVTDFQPFDINSINNDELMAIAAFILKGEDYDSLIRYLEDSGISDYSIILALWGALEGYSSIHKGLVSQFVTPQTFNLINSFVGIKSCDQFFPQQKALLFDTCISKGKGISDNIEKKDTDFKKVEEFSLFFNKICKACKSASKDEQIYKNYYIQYGLSPDLLTALNADSSLQKGKGAPKSVIKSVEKMLSVSMATNKTKKSQSVSLSLFDTSKGTAPLHIKNYEKAVSFVKATAPKELYKKLIGNLEYIDKEYTGNGQYANTDADPVIHFFRLCFSQSNIWNRIDETSKNREYVEHICKILNGN